MHLKFVRGFIEEDTSVISSAEDIDELCNDLRVDVEHIAESLR